MKRKRATDLPENFGISDRVKTWALVNNRYDRLEEHLEYFVLKVEANGYRYVNWDSALITAIRDDWAKLRSRKQTNGHNIVELGKSLGINPRPGEEMETYQRRIMAARH